MKRNSKLVIIIILLLITVCIALYFVISGPVQDKSIEREPEEAMSKYKEAQEREPEEAMSKYREAQRLMAIGRYEDGYEAAEQAMALFVKNKVSLAWMLLESIDLQNVRIDVHFNMGPRERKSPSIGIVKPLSFRVWSKGENLDLLEIIDFEIGMIDGKRETAALGNTTATEHASFVMLDVDSSYEVVRSRAIELIKNKHSSP